MTYRFGHALWTGLLLASCTVGPSYHVPAAPTPNAPAYKEAAGAWKVANPSDTLPRGAWWKMFHDPELDALEARLNINNQTIVQAIENYQAARAQIRAARSRYFPTITADPSATWLRTSGVSAGGAPSSLAGGQTTTGISAGRRTVFVAPVEASWAPDLFGRVRSSVRQAQAAAQVSAADLASTRLLAQGTLAQTYFQIRGQDALLDVLNETVAADEQICNLTQLLYKHGLYPEVSLVQAELTLQTARVQATNSAILRAQYEHAIATLVGVPATTFALPHRASLPTPPAIPTGAPSTLLERRPDIAAAERQMAAANAAIGVGYAAYYPLLTLSGTAGLASAALDTLVSWPSRVWSIGANLSETVFDGGLRRAVIDQSIAAYHAIVASYRQTVLAAFQQVEDTLAETRVLAQAIDQQRIAVALAQHAFDLEKPRYERGLDPYITLAVQQTALLSARQVLVELTIQQMTATVLLVEALGAGWSRAELPS